MSIKDKLFFKSTYSFELWPAAILGSRVDGAVFLGIFDIDTARGWINPETQHAQVYPQLPENTPDDPSKYEFVKFRMPNGKIEVYGLPWIKENSLESEQLGTLTIIVEGVGPEEKNQIDRALQANGFRAASLILE